MRCWPGALPSISSERQKIPIKTPKTISSTVCFLILSFSSCVDNNQFRFPSAVILEKTIRIPRSLSVKASSVLKGFLNKNPADRLGCRRETGFVDIIHHPFFKSVDWEMVPEPIQITHLIILADIGQTTTVTTNQKQQKKSAWKFCFEGIEIMAYLKKNIDANMFELITSIWQRPCNR